MKPVNFEFDNGDPVEATIGQGNISGRVIGICQFEDRDGETYLVEWLNGNNERRSEWLHSSALAITPAIGI